MRFALGALLPLKGEDIVVLAGLTVQGEGSGGDAGPLKGEDIVVLAGLTVQGEGSGASHLRLRGVSNPHKCPKGPRTDVLRRSEDG